MTLSVNDDVIVGRAGNDDLGGAAGDDDIHGGAGVDMVNGGSGNDLLHGGVGDDVLYGNDGLDILFGGGDADTFVFEAASAYNDVDVISDFSTPDGDAIDIADLLFAYDPITDAITDFVQITDNGTDSFLAVDADGGADNFVQIAQISNVTGLTDEEALETAGNLIV
ncbi:MAG: type I secretion C-terminal target domain-containing protein [Alphaproteobacteria bacterium]|nr:type I secretion C-terminal target domain-containing protein [Alphaproteobacteria bacterium]